MDTPTFIFSVHLYCNRCWTYTFSVADVESTFKKRPKNWCFKLLINSLLPLLSTTKFLNDNHIFYKYRFGFRRNHSTDLVLSFLKISQTLKFQKKNCIICFIENPLKMMKNDFYFILKALLVLKIFKLLSWIFGHD